MVQSWAAPDAWSLGLVNQMNNMSKVKPKLASVATILGANAPQRQAQSAATKLRRSM